MVLIEDSCPPGCTKRVTQPPAAGGHLPTVYEKLLDYVSNILVKRFLPDQRTIAKSEVEPRHARSLRRSGIDPKSLHHRCAKFRIFFYVIYERDESPAAARLIRDSKFFIVPRSVR